MPQFSANAQAVTPEGRATRELLAFFQNIFSGVIQRQGYTAAELGAITPTACATAFCTDSSVTTFRSVVAGGGANVVPVFGDGTNWRVG